MSEVREGDGAVDGCSGIVLVFKRGFIPIYEVRGEFMPTPLEGPNRLNTGMTNSASDPAAGGCAYVDPNGYKNQSIAGDALKSTKLAESGAPGSAPLNGWKQDSFNPTPGHGSKGHFG